MPSNRLPKSTEAPGAEQDARRAVFLDRDGVLNRNVWYPDTGAWESPRSAEELVLAEGVGPALRALRGAGYALVLVSNQPNAAKGKCSGAELGRIHERLLELLAAEGISLDRAFYCYHHPAHSGPCVCRKPSPHFLEEGARQLGLPLAQCWMIGDRDTDVLCGQAAGVKTVWVDTGEGRARPRGADLQASGLGEAVGQILRWR